MKKPKLIELSKNERYKEFEITKILNSVKPVKIKPKKTSPLHFSLDKGGNYAINLYLKELRIYPLLSREEETQYGRLSQNGDKESRKKMIVCNLRLVLKIARKYYQSGMDLLDLIEEGNLGLMRAVEKYDPEMGFRFSTYATWWIRQNIERAIMNQKHVVRLPIHIQKEYKMLKKKLREQSGEPKITSSVEEMSKLVSAPVDRVRKIIEWNERSFSVVSQDEDGNVNNIVDFLPDDRMPDPSCVLEWEEEKSCFDLYKTNISDRDREILIRRFGINEGKPSTLDEIGLSLGISRERVRQIIHEVIQKIRLEYQSGLLGD